jgi:hypothetical protein
MKKKTNSRSAFLFLMTLCFTALTPSYGVCYTDLDPTCNDTGLDDADVFCPGDCYVSGIVAQPAEWFATADDGTHLMWTPYLPNDSAQHPVVILINVGCFKGVNRGPGCVAQDLASDGFIVLAIDHRGACKKKQLPGQVCLAYSPEYLQNQISDVRRAIIAARTGTVADPNGTVISGRIDGKVGGVGGSSGASHALWCAIIGTPNSDKFDAAVLLSGIYEFDDANSLGDSHFSSDVDRYCRTNPTDPSRITHLQTGSPIYAITSAAVVPPLYFFATAQDTATPYQYADLKAKLMSVGATDVRSLLLPVADDMHDHAFEYWCTINGTTTVGQKVKTWLHSKLP